MKLIPTSPVPCAGCRLCCKNDAIFLHPECGDDPTNYETVKAVNPLTGKLSDMLAKQPNGDCIYLGAMGCTIHGRHPAICREFSCVGLYRSLSRADRKRYVALGMVGKDVLDAGRKRAGVPA